MYQNLVDFTRIADSSSMMSECEELVRDNIT